MQITISTTDKIRNVEINSGESLLDAINRAGIPGFDAPCGGKGTCGKCRVLVEGGTSPTPDNTEKKFLSDEDLKKGYRLACRLFPESDMNIVLPASGSRARIQTSFSGFIREEIIKDVPVYKKIFTVLPAPSIEDQRSDSRRLSDALADLMGPANKDKPEIPLRLLKMLPQVLRENDYSITISLFDEMIVGLEGGNTSENSYAAAVDIGTTTIAAYLVRLAGPNRGDITDFTSGLNSQKGYGGDVISRIEYTMSNAQDSKSCVRRSADRFQTCLKNLPGATG